MNSPPLPQMHRPTSAPGIVARVLVGVENTPASLEAVRQARILAGPHGWVTAVAVADIAAAAQAGAAAVHAAAQIRADAARALERAVSAGAPNVAKVVTGRPRETLLAQLAATGATLLALGAEPHRRATGLLLGAVGSSMLRHSPCSVLLSRPGRTGSWPQRIVTGVDASPQSLEAAAIAADLARTHDAELIVITALGGKTVHVDLVRELHPHVRVDPRSPVDALVYEGRAADLLVIGSRGRHGLGNLGSVSERVAHRATTSVLVIRAGSGYQSHRSAGAR